MQKIFIDTGFRQFYNYDCVFLPELNYRERQSLPQYCMSNSVKWDLEEIIGLQKKHFTVKENVSIHLMNSIPIAIEDLRAHYDIKRKEDTADYNVYFYDYEKSTKRIKTYETVLVFPEHQKVLCCLRGDMTASEAKSYFPEIGEDEECFKLQTLGILWNYDYKGVFPKILLDTTQKPCVPYDCLEFANPNELTIDVLQMTLMAAHGKDEQAFLTQLAILNQTNWTQYPGTMYYLRKFLRVTPLVSDIYKHSSSYSKLVNNILAGRSYSEGSNDLPLMQKMFNYVLGLHSDTSFVDFTTLYRKLIKLALYPDDLERVYTLVTRVKEKELENGQVYSQVE